MLIYRWCTIGPIELQRIILAQRGQSQDREFMVQFQIEYPPPEFGGVNLVENLRALVSRVRSVFCRTVEIKPLSQTRWLVEMRCRDRQLEAK